MGADHEMTANLLAAFVRHPNAGGVLVLGLGCENNTMPAFRELLGPVNEDRVKFMICQESEDEENSSPDQKKKTDVTKNSSPMKYELWNKAIQSYFFNDDSSSDIYMSIDRDSFIDYISEKGFLAEAIRKIQNYQRENGRPVVSEEDHIWADFLRLFGPRDCRKSSFFRTMKEQVSLLDSDGLYMMFPYLALFTMPLANSPELHSRNYYTRLTDFLRENQFVFDHGDNHN